MTRLRWYSTAFLPNRALVGQFVLLQILTDMVLGTSRELPLVDS